MISQQVNNNYHYRCYNYKRGNWPSYYEVKFVPKLLIKATIEGKKKKKKRPKDVADRSLIAYQGYKKGIKRN